MKTSRSRLLAEVTVVGPDRRGVVAGVTGAVFESQGNIEKINQNVVSGLFGMHLEASFDKNLDENRFRSRLRSLGSGLGMEVKVHFEEPDRPKNLAILVTKEPHCLEALLEAKKRSRLRANIVCIAGTEPVLKNHARKMKIPFFHIEHSSQVSAEKKLIELMEKFNVDFVALARYMRILTPNFVWRYPNRIINIHPSLLPAFQGAYPYVQAYERGAQIIGCTSHFVTDELDQGPIIWQDSFRVEQCQDLASIKEKGRELEAGALLKAVQLFSENKLEVVWGKVQFKSQIKH